MAIKVYYSSPGRRPPKTFATVADAIAWAKKNLDCKPVVVEVKETVLWDWQHGDRATVCEGKVRYASGLTALTESRAQQREGAWAVKHCTQCGGYHVEAVAT